MYKGWKPVRSCGGCESGGMKALPPTPTWFQKAEETERELRPSACPKSSLSLRKRIKIFMSATGSGVCPLAIISQFK